MNYGTEVLRHQTHFILFLSLPYNEVHKRIHSSRPRRRNIMTGTFPPIQTKTDASLK